MVINDEQMPSKFRVFIFRARDANRAAQRHNAPKAAAGAQGKMLGAEKFDSTMPVCEQLIGSDSLPFVNVV